MIYDERADGVSRADTAMHGDDLAEGQPAGSAGASLGRVGTCGLAERPSERSARVAAALGTFAGIRVSYEPQNELVAALDEARMTAIEVRTQRVETGRRLPMPVMQTVAEMGVGKTWAAERLEQRLRPADPDDRRRPVVIATLDNTGNPASVPAAILIALGKSAPSHVKPDAMWRRAKAALVQHGVELVVFDEMNRAARRPTMGPVIAGELMDLLVEGEVAVAFLGTPETQQIFKRAPALKDRLKSPVVMRALDWEANGDKAVFINFLGKMDNALAKASLTDRASGLDDEATAQLLWRVCRGRLRPLCLLLEEAVGIVHREARDLVLDHQALADAVESHSIPNEVIDHNPFLGETGA